MSYTHDHHSYRKPPVARGILQPYQPSESSTALHGAVSLNGPPKGDGGVTRAAKRPRGAVKDQQMMRVQSGLLLRQRILMVHADLFLSLKAGQQETELGLFHLYSGLSHQLSYTVEPSDMLMILCESRALARFHGRISREWDAKLNVLMEVLPMPVARKKTISLCTARVCGTNDEFPCFKVNVNVCLLNVGLVCCPFRPACAAISIVAVSHGNTARSCSSILAASSLVSDQPGRSLNSRKRSSCNCHGQPTISQG